MFIILCLLGGVWSRSCGSQKPAEQIPRSKLHIQTDSSKVSTAMAASWATMQGTHLLLQNLTRGKPCLHRCEAGWAGITTTRHHRLMQKSTWQTNSAHMWSLIFGWCATLPANGERHCGTPSLKWIRGSFASRLSRFMICAWIFAWHGMANGRARRPDAVQQRCDERVCETQVHNWNWRDFRAFFRQ